MIHVLCVVVYTTAINLVIIVYTCDRLYHDAVAQYNVTGSVKYIKPSMNRTMIHNMLLCIEL